MTLDTVAEARMSTTFERFPAKFSSPQTPAAEIDGHTLALFSSSNYLGLAEHPRLIAAACAATRRFGTGTGGSRLTTGTTSLHRELETKLAEFFGSEDAVFFATGYQANLSTIAAIADATVTVFSDQRNHASIIDGARLARATCRVFPHRDYRALASLLAARTTEYALVVTDGVFSMDGTLADVRELRRVCDAAGAWLMVDDAHAVGVLGAGGRGSAEHWGARADITIGTASKALGAEGGFTLCSTAVGRMLRNTARSFIFSTSPTPATCAAVRAALEEVTPALVGRLRDNVRHMAAELARNGLMDNSVDWFSPIFPIPIGAEDVAVAVSGRLRDAGFFAPAIRYPTVPRGEAIIRATVMSTHSPREISAFVACLADSTNSLRA